MFVKSSTVFVNYSLKIEENWNHSFKYVINSRKRILQIIRKVSWSNTRESM